MLNRYLLAPLAAFGLLAAPRLAWAQTTPPGGVTIGAATAPDPSAVLDLKSTSKGLLLPRLTLAQRTALTASTTAPPVPGLVIYQTDSTPGLYAYDGAAWVRLGADNLGNHTATQNLNLTTNKLVGGAAASPGTVGLSIDGNGLVKLAGVNNFNVLSNDVGLHLTNADAGLLVQGTLGQGVRSSISGAGERLMWAPYAAAFRAGGVNGTQWDAENIGFYSAAFGQNNLVDGNWAMASGLGNKVDGPYNTAVGLDNSTDGSSSATLAFGRQCRTKGNYSMAGGYLSKTQGTGAFALGERCTANAAYAIVMGRNASAATQTGTFTIGDASTTDSLRATTSNQFSARYAGGYRLYSNSAMGIGAELKAGGNAWTVLSDSTKKERRVLADGNRFLESINRMRLGSWNYIGQDPRTFRHYGPMAQDFYAAFGHDGVGTIGTATGINQADFDGVNLIAIQALYRQVQQLKADNAQLRQQVAQVVQVASAPGVPTPAPKPSWADQLAELRRQNAALHARAAAAEAQATTATATLETFEARLRRLESAAGEPAQARK